MHVRNNGKGDRGQQRDMSLYWCMGFTCCGEQISGMWLSRSDCFGGDEAGQLIVLAILWSETY